MLKHGAFFEIDILMYPYIPVLPAPLREARPGKNGALRCAGSNFGSGIAVRLVHTEESKNSKREF
jgi:hypothetical protein